MRVLGFFSWVGPWCGRQREKERKVVEDKEYKRVVWREIEDPVSNPDPLVYFA